MQTTLSAIHHYHCDHLSTPLALTDRAGCMVWAIKLDPWGNVLQEYNPQGLHQAIRLPGQHHDRETGLYYNRHRYYDPVVGEYVNQDPIGLRGGGNWYAYPQNPIIGTDPLGLEYVDGRLGMADRAAGIPSGGLSSTANIAVGAGGGFQTPFCFGMSADSGLVVDSKLNVCWYSNICYARGFRLSGSVGASMGATSGAATSDRVTYEGPTWSGGNGIAGSGAVMKGDDGSITYGKGTGGVGGGSSIGYQTCTFSTICAGD